MWNRLYTTAYHFRILFFFCYRLWEDRIASLIIWATVCRQFKLWIGTNWQKKTFWKEVCQSCLMQQLTMGGWQFHHNCPINFSSTCHTFGHARSMWIWSESLKVRHAVRQRWITKNEKWKIGQELRNLRISSILHSTFCTGGRKCNYTCPLSLFRQGRCVKMRGSGGICALWRPALPYFMLTLVLHSKRHLVARLWVESTRRWVQSNSNACVSVSGRMRVYRRAICLMPRVSRDSKNNEKLQGLQSKQPVISCGDGWYRPARSGNKHTYTLSHILAPASECHILWWHAWAKEKENHIFEKPLCVAGDWSKCFTHSFEVKTCNARHQLVII